MQIESLKVFCDVVRLHSFSQGAAVNHVLQSSASQTIHQLERHLGTVLIDRSCRPWKVTAEGKVFYDGCREIVDRYTAIEDAVKKTHDAKAAVVRVAAIYSVGLGDMNQCIQQFETQHPHAHVQIEYLHPNRVYERVLNAEADFGIVSFPPARRDLTRIPWRQERMIVVCSPQHPFARQKKITTTQLAGEKFVGFDKDLVIRREVDRHLKQLNVTVDVVLEFDNVEAIKRAVEVGSGISILPEPTVQREVAAAALVAVPLAGKEFARPVSIIHRHGKKLYANAASFVELLTHGGKGKIAHE
jgi:DNA-binding transcriptional LysR family regulator